jgi:AraC family transcriptional regulator
MKITSKEKSLNINLTLEDKVVKISLTLPISYKQKLAWESIDTKYCDEPIPWVSESSKQENMINVQIVYPKAARVEDLDEDINQLHLNLAPNHEIHHKTHYPLTLKLSTNDRFIQGLVLALVSELKTSGWHSHLSLGSEGTILSFVAHRHTASWRQSCKNLAHSLSQDNMRQVVDYIKNHLDQDLGLVKMASVAQMSLYHFARQFKSSIGATPHQYLNQCRMEKAKQLLAEKNLSILEITQQVGLQSPSHFTTLFRRSVGVTPSAYREKL